MTMRRDAVIGSRWLLDTGDMGYWLDGEIVITGRAKDLILHNGRNIWPQDIEWAAEQIEPLRSPVMSRRSRSKARMAKTRWWCWCNAACRISCEIEDAAPASVGRRASQSPALNATW